MSSHSSADSPADRQALQLARINFRQAVLVAAITAVAGTAGALIQGYFSSGRIQGLTSKLEHSDAKVKDLQGELAGPGASAVERDALYRLTADRFENDFKLTEGKGRSGSTGRLSQTELNYRLLRRAVFLNLDVLRANPTILQNTLDALVARGHPWVAEQKARIVAEFTQIKAIRLRWLQDVAVPQLERAINGAGPATQSIPFAQVALPREVWIQDSGQPPTVSVANLAELNEEIDLIKRSL
jgi:hypothetical protein